MSGRRKFLQQSASLAGAGLILPALDNSTFAYFRNKVMPSDQLNIGVIGVNGMGWSNMTSAVKIPGINLVAICDIDSTVIEKRMKELEKLKIDASKVKVYADYRKLLEQKDIDIVIVGTPDHWHALQMIEACQAGKDVYVEKPVGNSILECRAMVAAQQRYNRVVQAGQWQRSQQHFQDAVQFIRSGKLGNIRTVKVWCYQGWMRPQPKVPDSAPPPGVDYTMWLGPAPKRTFNASRFHFHFRWFWDYAGGLMTDWGVHLMDYAVYGMNADVPKSVSALGGNFAYPDLYEETPDSMGALYEFDNFTLIWDHAMGIDNGLYNRDHGIAYYGNNGTLVLDRGGWEVWEENKSKEKVSMERKTVSHNGLDSHWENFVGVVKSRKMEDLHCSIQTGAHIATVCQLGNIAYRSQRKLDWDKAQGKFTDEDVNKAYLGKEYHNGYQLPKV
jgi:predicted dehydrogenase